MKFWGRRINRACKFLFVLCCIVGVFGCGAINLGKWKGLERTASDEQYYLVKDVFLTAGSAFSPKEVFDHGLADTVNLYFIPKNEKNVYKAESIWFDPMGQEYRTIRQTYDLQQETKKGDDRQKGGSTRIHTVTTRELYNHKPGLWKVALYLDDQLVRRLSFTVR